jgi:hypothetical protein
MQVLPLWGTYVGSASACLGMQVAVSVTEEPSHSDAIIESDRLASPNTLT